MHLRDCIQLRSGDWMMEWGSVALDSALAPYHLTLVNPKWSAGGPMGLKCALHFDGTGKTLAYLEKRVRIGSG